MTWHQKYVIAKRLNNYIFEDENDYVSIMKKNNTDYGTIEVQNLTLGQAITQEKKKDVHKFSTKFLVKIGLMDNSFQMNDCNVLKTLSVRNVTVWRMNCAISTFKILFN